MNVNGQRITRCRSLMKASRTRQKKLIQLGRSFPGLEARPIPLLHWWLKLVEKTNLQAYRISQTTVDP